MKTTIAILFLISVVIIGCKKNEIETNNELTDGFCIVVNNETVVNHKDIEFYDYSSHLLYLKNIKSFPGNIKEYGTYTVYADKDEIYSGKLFPLNYTTLPTEPTIFAKHSMYGDYIIPIEFNFNQLWDTLGNVLPDPREDERIVDALKKYNQFHAGLSCEIKSVQYLSSNNVNVELLLKNNDSFNYYYLDPDKTGIGLFHYFTNGLFIRDFNTYKTYTHKIETVAADAWDTWENDWLSIINGNESKVITLVYDNFENVPKGQYKATFEFPGLGIQVDRKDVIQENGQIWLGELKIIKEIKIE